MDYKNTYCNPIKIEDYPKGYELPSYRSLADPSVLFTMENGICIQVTKWCTSRKIL